MTWQLTPGFLRAAGASAEALQTAIGFPVINGNFIASVLLISADQTPLARGYEIWKQCEQGYQLAKSCYSGLDSFFIREDGSTMSVRESWAGLIDEAEMAVVSNDLAVMNATGIGMDQLNGAASGKDPVTGIAIPHFEGGSLESFVVLIL